MTEEIQYNTMNRVILFDGVCNYCNTMVNFVIRRDTRQKFRFAPLQSEAGQQLRSLYQVNDKVDSLVYIENGQAFIYSTAVLKICGHLPGIWRVFAVGLVLPRFIRDSLYKWLARNRYKWFGSKETCMIPTPEVRARFLM
jgi:predicted DCC family thiol-disulfide oxidoreductase YuxK